MQPCGVVFVHNSLAHLLMCLCREHKIYINPWYKNLMAWNWKKWDKIPYRKALQKIIQIWQATNSSTKSSRFWKWQYQICSSDIWQQWTSSQSFPIPHLCWVLFLYCENFVLLPPSLQTFFIPTLFVYTISMRTDVKGHGARKYKWGGNMEGDGRYRPRKLWGQREREETKGRKGMREEE